MLGGHLPSSEEMNRLVEHYPTYEWEHRFGLLKGFFEGKSVAELVGDKLKAKGTTRPIARQARGGHTRWVLAKARKTVIRLIYLRYRIDEGMTRIRANQKIVAKFSVSQSMEDAGASNIRKTTHSPILDKTKPN